MDYNRSGHQTGLRIEIVIDWKLFLSIRVRCGDSASADLARQSSSRKPGTVIAACSGYFSISVGGLGARDLALGFAVEFRFDDALAFGSLHIQRDGSRNGRVGAAVEKERVVEEAGVGEGNDGERVVRVGGVGGLGEDGVLGPVEVDAAEPGSLGGEDGERGGGLVEGVGGDGGGDLAGTGVQVGELVEAGGVDDDVPGEGIAGGWASEDAVDGLSEDRRGTGQGSQRGYGHGRVLLGEVDGFGMLVEAEDPEGNDGHEREDGPAATCERWLAFADLGVDEAEEGGGDEGEEEQEEEDGLEDEDEGAGVPVGVEGEEGAQAVVVGPVQEEVREEGEEGEEEEQGPVWWGFGFGYAGGAPAEAVVGVKGEGDESGFERDAEEGVGDAAMMLEAGERAAEGEEGVDVGELGRDGHGEGGVGGATVEAGAGEDYAGEDVGDGLHRSSMRQCGAVKCIMGQFGTLVGRSFWHGADQCRGGGGEAAGRASAP